MRSCLDCDGPLPEGCQVNRQICDACREDRNRARNRARSEEQRLRYNLRSRYGITPETYASMLEAQGGGCDICGEACASGQRLSVDHDHTTGEVRGLLCGHCNRGIGQLKDSSEILFQAARYLRRHGS